jgi:hypothetical protein
VYYILRKNVYNNNNVCKSLGDIFGGNFYYQPWNVLGHMIPGLFLLLLFWNKKEELAIIELFLAGILPVREESYNQTLLDSI